MDEKLLEYLDKYIENREQQLNERKDEARGAISDSTNRTLGSADLADYGENVKRAEIALLELIKVRRYLTEYKDN